MDSVNCATSAPGPVANRPLRETGERVFMLCWGLNVRRSGAEVTPEGGAGWALTGAPGLIGSGIMKDLTSPRVIKFKGLLFLIIGLVAGCLVVLEAPSVRIGVFLAICVWCFCRFYYFAFYVIEHYVDPGFRFSGLWSFFCYLARKKRTSQSGAGDGGKKSD
jgi:hypothetical protein